MPWSVEKTPRSEHYANATNYASKSASIRTSKSTTIYASTWCSSVVVRTDYRSRPLFGPPEAG
jgi:hypothetical protein